jgi:sulfatase maturation enzyme AslB (radical SAM superfamily)
MHIDNVQHLHIELTTKCNARCPMCIRNVGGYPYNSGYPLSELSLSDFKTILPESFLNQIDTVLFNGNVGDFAVANDASEILEYVSKNTNSITIHTNASVRNTSWWGGLAHDNVNIHFALDGLKDTHAIHRIGTNFDKVLNNAKAFIDNGGIATWKMIEFSHNKHQVDECKEQSKIHNFKNFKSVNDGGREEATVYNRNGDFAYNIGKIDVTPPTIEYQIELINNDNNNIDNDFGLDKESPIECKVHLGNKQIYIAGNGDVYPCCFVGMFPKTMKYPGNPQLKQIVNKINALEYSLEESIEWFDNLYSTWGTSNQAIGCLMNCSKQ